MTADGTPSRPDPFGEYADDFGREITPAELAEMEKERKRQFLASRPIVRWAARQGLMLYQGAPGCKFPLKDYFEAGPGERNWAFRPWKGIGTALALVPSDMAVLDGDTAEGRAASRGDGLAAAFRHPVQDERRREAVLPHREPAQADDPRAPGPGRPAQPALQVDLVQDRRRRRRLRLRDHHRQRGPPGPPGERARRARRGQVLGRGPARLRHRARPDPRGRRRRPLG